MVLGEWPTRPPKSYVRVQRTGGPLPLSFRDCTSGVRSRDLHRVVTGPEIRHSGNLFRSRNPTTRWVGPTPTPPLLFPFSRGKSRLKWTVRTTCIHFFRRLHYPSVPNNMIRGMKPLTLKSTLYDFVFSVEEVTFFIPKTSSSRKKRLKKGSKRTCYEKQGVNLYPNLYVYVSS